MQTKQINPKNLHEDDSHDNHEATSNTRHLNPHYTSYVLKTHYLVVGLNCPSPILIPLRSQANIDAVGPQQMEINKHSSIPVTFINMNAFVASPDQLETLTQPSV